MTGSRAPLSGPAPPRQRRTLPRPHPPLAELRDISKAFGATQALRGVSLDLRAGEVHALAGENGAGKSTLIRILSGVHVDYQGQLLIGDQPVKLRGPVDAARAGIATIHQELSLVGSMSVADNLLLGRDRGWLLGPTPRRKRQQHAEQILARAGLDLDPSQPVERLPLAVRQLVEIAKALDRQAQVLVMDEPTSALSEREADQLLERLAELREQGRGVVYVSHRLEELLRVADRITVLRDGQLVRSAPTGQWTRGQLVRAIAGRDVAPRPRPARQQSSQCVLKVRRLSVPDPARPGGALVDRLDLELRAGEVLGLAGVRGSGISAALHGLFGAYGSAAQGEVSLDGEPLPLASPRQAIERGLVLLGADRKRSLVQDLSVLHNASLSSLGRFARWGWIDSRAERAAVAECTERLGLVAASELAKARTLSGGNQQKVALARCLLSKPKVLLLDEPTRGIDVGAKADIYQLIAELAGQGVAIGLVASEWDELLDLSDRILVLCEGRAVACLTRPEFSRERILRAAMGGGMQIR